MNELRLLFVAGAVAGVLAACFSNELHLNEELCLPLLVLWHVRWYPNARKYTIISRPFASHAQSQCLSPHTHPRTHTSLRSETRFPKA